MFVLTILQDLSASQRAQETPLRRAPEPPREAAVEHPREVVSQYPHGIAHESLRQTVVAQGSESRVALDAGATPLASDRGSSSR